MPSKYTSTTTSNTIRLDETIQTSLLTFKSLVESYILPTLPPPLSTLVSTTLSTLETTLPYISTLVRTSNGLFAKLLDSNAGTPEASALVTTLVVLVGTYLSFKILNYVRRTIVGWILFAFKLVFFLVAVQVGLYVWTFGAEKFVRDVSWWAGIVWGFVEEIWNQQDVVAGGGRLPRGMRSRGGGGAQVPLQRAGGRRTDWY